MQTTRSVTFEQVVARVVLNGALYDRVMSEPDAVAAVTTGLADDEVARLRSVLRQIRCANQATTAAVDRVTRAADRTMQK